MNNADTPPPMKDSADWLKKGRMKERSQEDLLNFQDRDEKGN